MKKYLLIILLLPILANAQSVSFEFNNLLENIFSPETAKPEFFIPENPTAEDLSLVKQTILQEYQGLQEFEIEILNSQARLYELASQKNNLEKELALLDADLNLAKQKLVQYTALEKSNIDKASRANDLVSQVAKLALESNIKIRGENSTSNKFGSNQTWDNMWSAIQNNNYSGLTLYRIENITSNPLAFDFLEWIIDNMKN